MVQHIKTYKFNSPISQLKKKKTYDHLIRSWKSIWQNPTPLHDKCVGEIRTTRNISKCTKSNIQQANSQHNGEKFKVLPLKPETRQCSPLSPYIFPSFKVQARTNDNKRSPRGFKLERKRLNSLFADDTTVYISNK